MAHAHVPVSPALRARLAPFTETVHGSAGEAADDHIGLVELGKRLNSLEELFQIEWCESCGGYVDATTQAASKQKATSAAFPTPPDL